MNISGVTGTAAAFEGSRVTAQQQATTTASTNQTQRDDDRQAQETDLKKTDTVTQDQGTSNSGETSGHHVNVVV
jgi:hypothetical protein